MCPRPSTRIAHTGRRAFVARLLLALALATGLAPAARAQGVELTTLEAHRTDGEVTLEFAARLTLTRSVEDALQRGVPMHFVAQASLYRSRWYWRDERVARVTRQWRLSYQPLTATWRVGLGALGQSFGSLSEALAVISRASWRLTDAAGLEPDSRHYIEFSYRLDATQLPRPLQIGLGNDWTLGVERTLKLE
jgi:hypothetical protein